MKDHETRIRARAARLNSIVDARVSESADDLSDCAELNYSVECAKSTCVVAIEQICEICRIREGKNWRWSTGCAVPQGVVRIVEIVLIY